MAVLDLVGNSQKVGASLILNLGKYFKSGKTPQPATLANCWRAERMTWTKFVREWSDEEKILEKFVVPNVSNDDNIR